MVLAGGVGFRACSAVGAVLRESSGELSPAPCANTVQLWLLRLGLHELQRPKERADDWILLIDHTLQLGSWKCLLIVGVRQSAWQRLERPLAHHDLTLLDLKPVQKSDGDQVAERLEGVAKQVGLPLAILSDEGSDLANGMAQFKEKYFKTQMLNDLAHKAAIFLKRELLADPRWQAFVQHCGQSQPRVKQTELGHLAPPTLKVKARYMNLAPLIRWGAKMLQLVDQPASSRLAGLDLSRLQEKFGWIGNFRSALVDWNDLETVKEHVLEYGRVQGYHSRASKELTQQVRTLAHTAPGHRLASALVEFIDEQSANVPAGQSLPASSEVLESLIGKGKRLQGQHSRGGFTKMILGMGASVVRLSQKRLAQGLESVRNVDLLQWCQQNLGASLTAQRRQALPAIVGTKTG
jgi:hypothetical protein